MNMTRIGPRDDQVSFAERIGRLEENGTIEADRKSRQPLPPPMPLKSGPAQHMLDDDRERT